LDVAEIQEQYVYPRPPIQSSIASKASIPVPNQPKTRAVDTLADLPPALRDHLREVAEESGVDPIEYRSKEHTVKLSDGRDCEVWYDEGASCALTAWKAFVMGVGTLSGPSAKEAVARHEKAATALPVAHASATPSRHR
jgi:hypothetical protein